MIQRKSAIQNKSLVNSASEEHFNIVKGIRDDAPITDMNSVIKSVNFESDGDGSYVLRKPLMKKADLLRYSETYSTRQFLLSNKQDVLTYHISGSTITNTNTYILRFYDSSLKLHEYEYTDILPSNWLRKVVSSYNTPDHTILNVEIDHNIFLHNIDSENNEVVTAGSSISDLSRSWKWMLVHDQVSSNGYIPNTSSIGVVLKRFIKVYPHESKENTYVFEIVTPEFNSITSGLDVGNAETLDINLLLDNPYAIRDLYGYGHVSTTKIIPYIYIPDNGTTEIDFSKIPLWRLTEEPATTTSGFKILVGANRDSFAAAKKKYLIIKAFLTTAVTNADYWCCWEQSTNGGVDWTSCQEFLNKATAAGLTKTTKTVSDLTYKDFTKKLEEESLTNASSYLVEKELVHLDLDSKDFSELDLIEKRPDVLILENPDLGILYRFQIYVDTHQQSPTPVDVTETVEKSGFDSLSGNIDESGKIKFLVEKNNADVAPTVEDACLLLNEGPVNIPKIKDGNLQDVSKIHTPYTRVGNTLKIYTENEDVKLKTVSVLLASSETVDSNTTKYIGTFLGASKESHSLEHLTTLSTDLLISNTDTPTTVSGLYDIKTTLTYSQLTANTSYYGVTSISNVTNLMSNHWTIATGQRTFDVSLYDNDKKQIYIANISNAGFSSNLMPIKGVDSSITDLHIISSYANNDHTITIWYQTPENTYNHYSSETEDTIEHLSNRDIQRLNYTVFCVSFNTLMDNIIRARTKSYTYFPSYPPDQHDVWSSDDPETVNTSGLKVLELENSNDITTYNIQKSNGYPTALSDTEISQFEYDRITDYVNTKVAGYVWASRTSISEYLNSLSNTLSVNNLNQIISKIKKITVTYTYSKTVDFTSTYLNSTTGNFQIPYNTTFVVAEDLSVERSRLFQGEMYFNEKQSQLLIYKDNFIYVSGTNSAVIKLLNSNYFPEEITKLINWRGYLLLFSDKNIYLANYDSSIDGYSIKVLSNTVGVSKEDADTVIPILNSVYFKSGTKIYKLVPNLYAASDDILNIHQISTGVNNILEKIVNTYIEKHNFGYSDSDMYMLFIPIESLNKTYCITYNFDKHIWNFYEYPVYLNDIERISIHEAFLYDNSTTYYFKERMTYLIAQGLRKYCETNDLNFEDFDIQRYTDMVPYTDYLITSPEELITRVLENTETSNSVDATFTPIMTPINFEIDFGQKSSNYTLYKQFLETKITLATLSARDNFPFDLKIYTNGMPQLINIKWDCNTDGALWKENLDDLDILNTDFATGGTEFNGIMRQLIVKYSGRGKTIRHVLSGKSKSLFKFYSMDVRSRILPKKQ